LSREQRKTGKRKTSEAQKGWWMNPRKEERSGEKGSGEEGRPEKKE
jgi:hypothetical protein